MIDWNQVTQLCDEVGKDEFAEVVEIFLEEVEGVTSRLANGLNVKNLRDDLHFLKGSALNLGFEALSHLCQAAENMAADGRAQEVEIQKILDCYALSKQSFLKGIEERAVA